MTALYEEETWFLLREPGRVPQRKGPVIGGQKVKEFLIELMVARPDAFITVLTWGEASGPLAQDGPECLMMLDMRQRSRARRHIKSSRAAFALAHA
jgi:hypothetical protein